MIQEATGKLEAAKLEAQARLALATAEAEALKAVNAAITPEIASFTIAKETAKAAQQLAASPNKTYVLSSQSLFAPFVAAADMLGKSLSTGAKPRIAAEDTSSKLKK